MAMSKTLPKPATRQIDYNQFHVIGFTGWWLLECDKPFILDIMRPQRPSTSVAVGFIGCGLPGFQSDTMLGAYVGVYVSPDGIASAERENCFYGAWCEVWLENGDEVQFSACVGAMNTLAKCWLTYLGEHQMRFGAVRSEIGPVSQLEQS